MNGDRIQFRIDPELTMQLNRLAMTHDSTLYMVLLAAYYIMLYKYTGQEDIVIGTNVAGRSHPDLENIIGMFLNVLPLRNYPRGDLAFREFLAQVRRNTLDAFDNQDYPFERLLSKLNIKWDQNRNPLFDTVFTMQDFKDREVRIDSFNIVPFDIPIPIARMDLILILAETNQGIEVIVEYSTKLFKRSRMESLPKHYQELLAQFVANPDGLIRNLEMANLRLAATTTTLASDTADFQF